MYITSIDNGIISYDTNINTYDDYYCFTEKYIGIEDVVIPCTCNTSCNIFIDEYEYLRKHG